MPGDLDSELYSWSHVGTVDGRGPIQMFGPATEYEPSIHSDFSEMLPLVSDFSEPVSENYSTDLVVQSAWKSFAEQGT